MKIDTDKCYKAMEQLTITGSPVDGNDKLLRSAVIEESIAEILKDTLCDLCKGVKVYSGFGDQRFDLSGCPRHGQVVFRINRKGGFDLDFDKDACVYFLQAVRDYQSQPFDNARNLADAIQEHDRLTNKAQEIFDSIENTAFDFENKS